VKISSGKCAAFSWQTPLLRELLQFLVDAPVPETSAPADRSKQAVAISHLHRWQNQVRTNPFGVNTSMGGSIRNKNVSKQRTLTFKINTYRMRPIIASLTTFRINTSSISVDSKTT